MRRYFHLTILVSACCLTLGCTHTLAGLKQTGKGIVKDIKSLADKDNPVQKADEWVQENLW